MTHLVMALVLPDGHVSITRNVQVSHTSMVRSFEHGLGVVLFTGNQWKQKQHQWPLNNTWTNTNGTLCCVVLAGPVGNNGPPHVGDKAIHPKLVQEQSHSLTRLDPGSKLQS